MSDALALLCPILAMTDHDRQLPRVGQVKYDAAKSPTGDGEAVGVGLQTGMAVRPPLCSFAGTQLRLFGQYSSGRTATPMKRSDSEDLTH